MVRFQNNRLKDIFKNINIVYLIYERETYCSSPPYTFNLLNCISDPTPNNKVMISRKNPLEL